MTTDSTDPVLDPQLQARAERAAWWEDTQARRSRNVRHLCRQIAYLDLDDPDRPGMIRQLVDIATLYLNRTGQPRDLDDVTVLIPPDGIGP